MRSRLVEPFRVQEEEVDAERFTAAAELLLVALTHHPSLTDILLFPTALSESASGSPSDVSPPIRVMQLFDLTVVS